MKIHNFDLKVTLGLMMILFLLEVFMLTLMLTGRYTSPLCLESSAL